MANHKSAIKRIRQTETKNRRNSAYRTLLKNITKKALAEVQNKNKDKAQEMLKLATKVISKIASKGVIHRKTASRKISNLAKRVHQLSSTA
ncbi:MAG: 30S ribosomal protein S20 [Nitrospinales bacterium]